MSLTGLGIIVIAAFIHATWNLFAKRASGGSAFVWLYSAVAFVLYAPIIIILVLLDPPKYGFVEWSFICSSGIIHIFYSIALQRGYQLADLSVVYPLARGTGPLISGLGAMLLFGERPTPGGLIGIGLIVFGILLLSGGSSLLLFRDRGVLKGILIGSLTGLFIAGYTLNDGYAVRYLMISPIFLDYFGNFVRLAFLTPTVLLQSRQLCQEWRLNMRPALAVGGLIPLSYILALFAMRLSPVSYVAAARELSMLIGAFFGVKLLNEGDIRRRLFGAALMLLGIFGLIIG